MKHAKYEEDSPSMHYLPSGVKLASLGSRIVAILIDFIIVLFLLLFLDIEIWGVNDDAISFLGLLNFFTMMTNPFSFAILVIVGLIVGLIEGSIVELFSFFGLFGFFAFFYWIILEGLNDGQTLGKMFVGIRVVKIDKTSGTISRCTIRDSVIRNLSRIIDGLPLFYIVGLMSIADSDLNQRVGDYLAETIVIKA